MLLALIDSVFFAVYVTIGYFFIKFLIKTILKEIDEYKKEKEKEAKTKPAELKSEVKEVIKSEPIAAVKPLSSPSPPTPLTRATPHYRRFTHGDNDYYFRTTPAAMLGEVGESNVLNELKERLDKRYAILHNIVLKTDLGDTTQIDFVVLSIYGVFVIEVKNYSGWVFGSVDNRDWTHIVHRKKYKFMNPLRQNYKHIKALSFISAMPMNHFQSLIVFPASNVEFKTTMPSNVVRSPVSYIQQHKQKIFNNQQIETLYKTIISAQTLQ